MRRNDWLAVGGVAVLMAPFTYFAGARLWGWDPQWGLPYLVANVAVPAVLAVILHTIRSSQK